MLTEADTCRKYILPKLLAAGWDNEPHSIAEQRTFTDGRIVVTGGAKVRRKEQKRADYILRVRRDFPLAVIEAKAAHRKIGDGLQQAKDYAIILDVPFAYASNGKTIVEFDFLTGQETIIETFPTPEQLWKRSCAKHALSNEKAERLLGPDEWAKGLRPNEDIWGQ